jgi:hypothetical protein
MAHGVRRVRRRAFCVAAVRDLRRRERCLRSVTSLRWSHVHIYAVSLDAPVVPLASPHPAEMIQIIGTALQARLCERGLGLLGVY